MKNKHLPTLGTLICILALLGCSKPDVKWIGEPAPDERAKMGLKGPVVKVTSSYFDAKDTTATLDSLLLTMPVSVFENTFASSGQGIESKHWTRGTFSYHEVYQLNEHLQITEIQYNREGGEPLSHASMAYFPNGLLREEQYFDENGALYRQELHTYDDLNRLAETLTKRFENGEDGDPVTELMVMEYEDTTPLLKRRTHSKGTQVTYVQEYDKGVLLTTTMNTSGEVSRFKHDAQGNFISSEDFVNGKYRKSAYFAQFDAKGNRIRILEYGPENTLELWQTWRYDSLGNQLEQRSAYASSLVPNPQNADTLHPNIVTFDYQFDDRGNILRRVETKNGHLSSVMVRELVYEAPPAKKPTP